MTCVIGPIHGRFEVILDLWPTFAVTISKQQCSQESSHVVAHDASSHPISISQQTKESSQSHKRADEAQQQTGEDNILGDYSGCGGRLFQFE